MKTIGLLSVLLAAALFAGGCSHDSTNHATVLEFRTIEQASHSAISGERFVVVKDADSWRKLWAEHTEDRQPAPPLPVIDFGEAMVLGVFLGDRPNTCYRVTIETVERSADDRLRVNYREQKTGTVCGQAITQPLHLISLKSMELPVEFIALR